MDGHRGIRRMGGMLRPLGVDLEVIRDGDGGRPDGGIGWGIEGHKRHGIGDHCAIGLIVREFDPVVFVGLEGKGQGVLGIEENLLSG